MKQSKIRWLKKNLNLLVVCSISNSCCCGNTTNVHFLVDSSDVANLGSKLSAYKVFWVLTNNASLSLKVVLLCRYETVYVNLRRKPDWLYELNPCGLVPILEYKGHVVYESDVCNEFLEKTFPGSNTGTRDLLPSCPKERATMQFLLQKFDKVC